MADWWSGSLRFGILARPSPTAVKLWLQLVEQSMGLGDSSPQLAAIVATITRVVRGDVYQGLTGKRELSSVQWFATLQQCPNMANEVLFTWDAYNAFVSDGSAVQRLAQLPVLLCDVIVYSAPTLALLRQLLVSEDVTCLTCGIQALASQEQLLNLDGAVNAIANCTTIFDVDLQRAVALCLSNYPALFSFPVIQAACARALSSRFLSVEMKAAFRTRVHDTAEAQAAAAASSIAQPEPRQVHAILGNNRWHRLPDRVARPVLSVMRISAAACRSLCAAHPLSC